MNTMGLVSRCIALTFAVSLGAALATGSGVASADTDTGDGSGTASATAPQAPQTSNDFDVYNKSGKPVKLVGYQDNDRPARGPEIGAEIQPGEKAGFNVIWRFFADTWIHPIFETKDKSERYNVDILVPAVTHTPKVYCVAHAGTCNVKDSTVEMLDAPGTEIYYGPGQGQKLAEVLNTLCVDGSKVTCTFDKTSETTLSTDKHQVGHAVKNNTSNEVTKKWAEGDTVGWTNSVQLAAKAAAKVGPLVNVEFSATFGHTWNESHTFTEELTLKIPPGFESIVYAEQPLDRIYGDFKLTVGNTTYHLKDVYFDSPPRQGKGHYDVTERPITPGPGIDVSTLPDSGGKPPASPRSH